MKVYVTQGHESGIGLEVFFKSLTMMSHREIDSLVLIADKKSVSNTLKTLSFPYAFHEKSLEVGGSNISTVWIENSKNPSFTSLDLGMKLSEAGGVLFTLPTSKDQFPQGMAGHTEYFRKVYRREELGMFFSSPSLQVLLLSDHLAIKDLSEHLSEEKIRQRLNLALKTLQNWSRLISRVLVSGLNPHAGEGGLLGDEDVRVKQALSKIKPKFKLDMAGPYPGDTMLLEQKSPQDLLVYLFHDQGLGVFKGQQGFIGANITLGLPYPRVSPDHGTSFSLFGKDQADYRGCLYALREAISLKENISHGKNSGQ
jgi:4-hydroxythreonine-4-phosphate dehydrogenase